MIKWIRTSRLSIITLSVDDEGSTCRGTNRAGLHHPGRRGSAAAEEGDVAQARARKCAGGVARGRRDLGGRGVLGQCGGKRGGRECVLFSSSSLLSLQVLEVLEP